MLLVALFTQLASTDTNCWINGHYVSCSTQSAAPLNLAPTDFLSGLGMGSNQPNRRDAAPPAPVAAPDQQRYAAWNHLADLIKAHRCEEAIDFAIRQGGTEAGLRAKALCQ